MRNIVNKLGGITTTVLLGLVACLIIFLIVMTTTTRYGETYTVVGTIEKVEVATAVYVPPWESQPLAVHLTDGTYLILPNGAILDGTGETYRFTLKPEKTLLWTYNRTIGVEPIK